MDYNRFVERIRKMYPEGKENSFDPKAEKEKGIQGARSDEQSASNEVQTNNGQNRIVHQGSNN